MKTTRGFFIAAALALLVAGCEGMPGSAPTTLIVDLSIVAKATGQEEFIQQQSQAAREELNAQLMEQAANLEQQLEVEREKIGDSPTDEQQQALQQMAAQAQQQYGQLQAEAQQQAQQNEVNLVLEFREQIRPYAEKLARSRRASVVLLVDNTLLWQDPAVDITDDLIGALRDEGVFANPSPAE